MKFNLMTNVKNSNVSVEKSAIIEALKIEELKGNKAVSARALYDFLGLDSSHWKRWYTKNIVNNEFALEDVDYQTFRHNGENAIGRPSEDFIISLDFAKKIAMMSKTQRGEEARQYFIDVEKNSEVRHSGMTQLQMLSMMAQEMVAIEQRQLQHQQMLEYQQEKLNELVEIQEENRRQLEHLNLSSDVLPDEDLRTTVLRLVNTYVALTGLRYNEVCKKVYGDVYYLYKIRLSSYKKVNNKESLLDVADRLGHMDKIHTVISDLVKNIGR